MPMIGDRWIYCTHCDKRERKLKELVIERDALRAEVKRLKVENKKLRAAIARVRDIPDPTGDIREALEVRDE